MIDVLVSHAFSFTPQYPTALRTSLLTPDQLLEDYVVARHGHQPLGVGACALGHLIGHAFAKQQANMRRNFVPCELAVSFNKASVSRRRSFDCNVRSHCSR